MRDSGVVLVVFEELQELCARRCPLQQTFQTDTLAAGHP